MLTCMVRLTMLTTFVVVALAAVAVRAQYWVNPEPDVQPPATHYWLAHTYQGHTDSCASHAFAHLIEHHHPNVFPKASREPHLVEYMYDESEFHQTLNWLSQQIVKAVTLDIIEQPLDRLWYGYTGHPLINEGYLYNTVVPTAVQYVHSCAFPSPPFEHNILTRFQSPLSPNAPWNCDFLTTMMPVKVEFDDVPAFLHQHGPVVLLDYATNHAITVHGWNHQGLIADDSSYKTAHPLSKIIIRPNMVDHFVERYVAIALLPVDTEAKFSMGPRIRPGIVDRLPIEKFTDTQLTIFALAAMVVLATMSLRAGACAMAGLFVVHTVIFANLTSIIMAVAFFSAVSFLFIISKGVRNHRITIAYASPLQVNQIKDDLRQLISHYKPPKVLVGQHVRLASERRSAEQWCFGLLYGAGFQRVRDVGGSRTRFPHLGYRKHICAAQNHNADILRDLKAPDSPFENCHHPGQNCPRRHDIPAAIMSHVDYYLNVDEIAACVTGPTFVINHRFKGAGGGFGTLKSEDGKQTYHEATWTNVDGQIRMSAPDGTAYSHPYNLWQNEGEIVPSNGASCVYSRVASFGDTDIYYVCPASGMYDASARTVLKRSQATNVELCTIHGNYKWSRVGHAYVFQDTVTDAVTSLDANLLDPIVSTMAASPRNAQFETTLASYVTSTLRARDETLTSNVHLAVALCQHLLVKAAFNRYEHRMLHGYEPLTATYMDTVKYAMAHWVYYALPTMLAASFTDLLRSEYIARVAVVFGVAHRVAPYEVLQESRLVTNKGTKMRYCFHDSSSPNHAGADDEPTNRAAKIEDKRHGKYGNACDQPDERADSGCHNVNRQRDHTPEQHPEPSVQSPEHCLDMHEDAADSASSISETESRNGVPSYTREVTAAGTGDVCREHGRSSKGHVKDKGTCHVRIVSNAGTTYAGGPQGTNADYVNFGTASIVSKNLEFEDGDELYRLVVNQGRKNMFQFRLYHAKGYNAVSMEVFRVVQKANVCEALDLLSALPPIKIGDINCAVRWALSNCGILVSSRSCHHQSSCKFMLRVYGFNEAGREDCDDIPITIRGVDYQIPRKTTRRAAHGREGSAVYDDPHHQEFQGQLFSENRDYIEDDRSEEHIPEIESISNHDWPVHQRTRTSANARRNGRPNGKGNSNAGKGRRPQNKGKRNP